MALDDSSGVILRHAVLRLDVLLLIEGIAAIDH